MLYRRLKLAEVLTPNNFHFALIDNLSKELKKSKIKHVKHKMYIEIPLTNLYEEKYSHIIADCLDGNAYLRSKIEGINDKKIGKLYKCTGGREADAISITSSIVKQIEKHLSKYDNKFNSFDINEGLTVESKLKKVSRLKKLNWFDAENRDKALLYINGKVYESYSHAEALGQYLKEDINEELYRSDMYDKLENNDSIAFAHLCDYDNAIIIEPDSLQNVNIKTVANILKEKYSNYAIYEDDDDANMIEELNKIAKKRE